MTARRVALTADQCQTFARRHAAGDTWAALAAEVGVGPDCLRERVRISTRQLPQEPRGHGRPALACGCSDSQRCAEGERLWEAMEAAGRLAHASHRMAPRWYVERWPAYAQAHQRYMEHLAANRVQARKEATQ